MSLLINSQRHNVDRLLALVLLWNVAGGAFVTLGAPWLSEIAGTTRLRPPAVLPSGSGWLAIGVPTHFAGIWLSMLGVYALQRMRRHLPWHLAAVLFYAPQTFAITSPLHLDMWIGLFAATHFQPPIGPAIAINWIATALLLVHALLALNWIVMTPLLFHAWLRLLDSKFHAPLAWMPRPALRLFRGFWGSAPLSRTALSRRYATVATITACAFLPLVPPEAFYASPQTLEFVQTQYFTGWFEKEDLMFWRRLLLLPVTFVAAYVIAFVWSGGQGEPRFSAKRGILAALLAYVYLGMAADLLSRWLSDGSEPLFRLFLIAWVFLLPLMLLVPVTGAVAGAWLGRKIAAPQEGDQRRSSRLTFGMLLTLAMPLLGLLLGYVLGASQRNRIEAAREVAQRALEHFDRNEPDRLYAMFMSDSLAMIDRDSFIATLRERRSSLGELRSGNARRELRHHWYFRAGVIQFDYSRVGAKSQSSESIVIDVHGAAPAVSAVFMTFEGQPPARNVFVPRRNCGDYELLHCGGSDDRPPRSLF
jgi:hypothetical protein